ncbi:MAG: methylmalonyl Co-A mutase-associated GTPase MeaB [Candidatus Dormibacteraeota bacterium]|nr:methylmalonyl Co-A mutase-associated GTPase MeaB [Candidatus Dormibacteraeota bacterium]MBO0746630.1 methylmalonyl Co-A mutase-associated GTPase MeaB [Candidatus Dormibacteraeota bacterium]
MGRGERLIDDFRAGRIRALARAITLVERGDEAVRPLLDEAVNGAARPLTWGFTGAPGSGKSTLVDALLERLRSQGSRVAVLAVDPTSPFTGGAVLGDRVRMQRHAGDEGVYIRSMGARGHLGGLSLATREALRLVGAFGFDRVVLETVGVGQSELEIAAVADSTVVVLAPGAGDGIQMLKAGIMEIADLYCVNKADLPGAQRTLQEVRTMLNMAPKPLRGQPAWRPPIVALSAVSGAGLDELLEALRRHQEFLEASGERRRRAEARLREETADLVADRARARALARLEADPGLLADRNPYLAADRIMSS